MWAHVPSYHPVSPIGSLSYLAGLQPVKSISAQKLSFIPGLQNRSCKQSCFPFQALSSTDLLPILFPFLSVGYMGQAAQP